VEHEVLVTVVVEAADPVLAEVRAVTLLLAATAEAAASAQVTAVASVGKGLGRPPVLFSAN
jgi:hypothetical protein